MEASQLPVIGSIIERLRTRSDHEGIKSAMETAGDVKKMDGYANMAGCLTRLTNIDAGRGTMGRPLRTAIESHNLLLKHRDVFTAAFRSDGSEAIRLVYANTVVALWHLVTLLCAEGVSSDKGQDGNYNMVVNPAGIKKLETSIFVTRLEKFNANVKKHGFKTLANESAPMVEREMFHEAIFTTIGLAIGGILGFIYIARDLTAKFYELRGSFHRWLSVQASFLEMNAASQGVRPASRERQEDYARRLRALADRVSIDDVDTERSAVRAIQMNDRELAEISSRSQSTSGGLAYSSQLL